MSNKKAQRTKGNVKPARSEKAATNLASFGEFRSESLQTSSLILDEASLNTVDPDLRQCLRRFSKRDASTKCKALSDFIAILEGKDVDSLVVALSHVVRAYNRLAIDNSRRVRELSQRYLQLTVGRVGREIAPHLRSLLPIWFLSMNDICASVSSAARTGFESTFPTETKQHDALWLARSELCSVLISVLLHPKDCTLLREDPAKEEDEADEEDTSEGETRSVRVTRAALRCLGQLVEFLCERLAHDSEAAHSFAEALSSIVGASRFWKIAHHESPLVRAAHLYCVGQLARHTSLLEPHIEHATRALSAHLNASEPLVCVSAWSALSELLSRHAAPALSNADASLLPSALAFLRAALRAQEACAPAVGALLVQLVCWPHPQPSPPDAKPAASAAAAAAAVESSAQAAPIESPSTAASTLQRVFAALDEGCSRSAATEPLVSRVQLNLLEALLSQPDVQPPVARLCVERIEQLLRNTFTSTSTRYTSHGELLFSTIRTLIQTAPQTSVPSQLWTVSEQLISKLYLHSAPGVVESADPPRLAPLVRFVAVMFSSQNYQRQERAPRAAPVSNEHELLQKLLQVPWDAAAARTMFLTLPQTANLLVRLAEFATALAGASPPTSERASFVLATACLLVRYAPLAPSLVGPADSLARRALALELEPPSEPLLLHLLEAIFEGGSEQLQEDALESLLSAARSSFLNLLVRTASAACSSHAGDAGGGALASIVAKLCLKPKFVALRRTSLDDSFSLLALDASVVESGQRADLLVNLAAWLALRMPRAAQDKSAGAQVEAQSEMRMCLDLFTQLRRAYEARALSSAASYSSLQQVVPFVRTLLLPAALEASTSDVSSDQLLVEVLAIDMNARLATNRSPTEFTKLWLDSLRAAPDQSALISKFVRTFVEIAASQPFSEVLTDVLVALTDVELSPSASAHQLVLHQLLDSLPKRPAQMDVLLQLTHYPQALQSNAPPATEPLSRSHCCELVARSLKLYRYYAALVTRLGAGCLVELPAAVEHICTARVLGSFAQSLQLPACESESLLAVEFALPREELLVEHSEPVFAHLASLDSAIAPLVLRELFAASAVSSALHARFLELARRRLASEQTLSTLAAGSAEAERRAALSLGVLARASADEASGRAALDWVREAFTNNLSSFALAVQLDREAGESGSGARAAGCTGVAEATCWLARLNELPLTDGQCSTQLEEAVLTLLDALPLAASAGQEARDWSVEALRFYARLLERKSPASNRTLHDRLLCRAAELARDLSADCEPLRLTTGALLLSELVHRISHALERCPASAAAGTESAELIFAMRSEWEEFFSPRLLEPLAVLFFEELRAVGSPIGDVLVSELRRARLVHLVRALGSCTHQTLVNSFAVVTADVLPPSFPLPSASAADASGTVRALYARLVSALVEPPPQWPVDAVALWQVLLQQLILHIVPRLSSELELQSLPVAGEVGLSLGARAEGAEADTPADEPVAPEEDEDEEEDEEEKEARVHPMQSAFARLQQPAVGESRPLPDVLIVEIAKCEPPVFEFCDQQPSGNLPRSASIPLRPKLLSYLLLWNVALAYLKCTELTRRRQYVRWLSESGVFERFLTCVFKMLPDPPLVSPPSRLRHASACNTGAPSRAGAPNLFACPPPVSACCALDSPQPQPLLEQAACQLYLEALREMPVLARHWHSRLDRRTEERAARYTAEYVSPQLCALELTAVKQQRFRLTAAPSAQAKASAATSADDAAAAGSIEIRTRPAAREVIATYTLQEGVTNEMVIELPLTYPLAPLVVKSGQLAGISVGLWRKWTLQLTAFLQNQNGSIVDSIGVWRCSVERALADVTECSICLAVLHPNDRSLPRLRCHTCRKRFHARCLYTWFQNASSATCPLCRTVF